MRAAIRIGPVHALADGGARCAGTRRTIATIACVLAIAPAALGQDPTPQPVSDVGSEPPPDVFQDPLAQDPEVGSDELLLFEDIPVVISATRVAQPIDESSVAISVLDADDIFYGGQTNLFEALQYLPGVDMLRVDRNRYAFGIRGLHEVFSDRTIALIDGRNASSPAFGGPEFLRLPLILDDIARVEVVRGPGGAAWGANAFNGVVNIITKEPAEVRGALLDVSVNEFGDVYTQARYADTTESGDLGWRISAGYQDVESSSDALNGESFDSRDFMRNLILDSELVAHLDPDNRLSVGLGYSDVEQGDFSFLGYWPMRDASLRMFRSHARLDHVFSDDTSGYVQLFLNHQDDDMPSFGEFSSYETDLELQVDHHFTEGHRLSLGGNIRYVDLTNKSTDPLQIQTPRSLDELWAGIFVIDRYQATERVALEGQLRVDYYSETDVDWSGRAAAIFALDEARQHMLRLSAARAFRAPLSALREASFIRPPQLVVINSPDIGNEHVGALEAGYTWRPRKELSFVTNAFFQEYDDLVGSTLVGIGPPAVFVLDNLDGAHAWGVEFETAWRTEGLLLSGWYTYHAFDLESDSHNVRAFQPAENKVGLTGRASLPWDLTFNANYKYTSETEGSFGFPGDIAPEFHRMDLTLTKSIASGKGELMVGVNDVFDDTDIRVPALGVTPHETPGRTFFLRFVVKF